MMTVSDSSPALRAAAASRHNAETTYLQAVVLELRMTLEEYFPGIDSIGFAAVDLERGGLRLGWGARADGSLVFDPSFAWSQTTQTGKLETLILYLLWRVLQHASAFTTRRLTGVFTLTVDDLRDADALIHRLVVS